MSQTKLTLEVVLTHKEGKFAQKDDLADEVIQLVDGAEIQVDDSIYEVEEVNLVENAKAPKLKKTKSSTTADPTEEEL
jgi:hypothetical protein